MIFCCPVCSAELERRGKSLFCENGHCYDISKYGYVNLLMSNQSSLKRHGDDMLMVEARRNFLNKGYYEPIRAAVISLALPELFGGAKVLDAGCGEGWYTQGLSAAAEKENKKIRLALSDISKDALRFAAGRLPEAELAVSSSARLPVPDGGCDMILNLFSPPEIAEFHRSLAPGGILIRALVLPRHLWSLKAAVYEKPYENGEPVTELEGFELIKRKNIREKITVYGEDILRLFSMTPYYYKTSEEDFKKLNKLESLTVELETAVLCYKAIKD